MFEVLFTYVTSGLELFYTPITLYLGVCEMPKLWARVQMANAKRVLEHYSVSSIFIWFFGAT